MDCFVASAPRNDVGGGAVHDAVVTRVGRGKRGCGCSARARPEHPGLQKAGVKFFAADMPEASEMVITIMAAVAGAERRMISERTKAALQAAKARGAKLGNIRQADRRKPPQRAARGAGRPLQSWQGTSLIGCAQCLASWRPCRLTLPPKSWIAVATPPRGAASGVLAR